MLVLYFFEINFYICVIFCKNIGKYVGIFTLFFIGKFVIFELEIVEKQIIIFKSF